MNKICILITVAHFWGLLLCAEIFRGTSISGDSMTTSFYRRKPVEELTFTDDGMFQAVMRDPDLCSELIERLLHLSVSRVEYPELEKTIAPYFSSKGVRLDVYLKAQERIIDIEMLSYPQREIGLPRYTFTTKCHELEGLNFGDKITKMIYNASGYEKETDARDFNAPLPKVLEKLSL